MKLVDGKVIFKDGTIAQGFFKDGVMYGIGNMIFTDGTLIEGNFKNNKLNGHAKKTIPKKSLDESEKGFNGLVEKGEYFNDTFIRGWHYEYKMDRMVKSNYPPKSYI